MVVATHPLFNKRIQKVLSRPQQEQLEALYDRVDTNPQQGRLLDPRGLREFRIGAKRVYFITDGTHTIFIDASSKKTQQKRINRIKRHFSVYQEALTSLSADE